MACCGDMLKCMLIAVNLVIVIGGIALIAGGARGMTHPKDIQNLLKHLPENDDVNEVLPHIKNHMGVVLKACVAMGVIFTVTGLFGMIATAMSSRILLGIMAALLLGLLIGELAMTIFVFVRLQKGDLKSEMSDFFSKQVETGTVGACELLNTMYFGSGCPT